jgi:hypothetical protein
MSLSQRTGMGTRQIDEALNRCVEHNFIVRWERHPNRRYWRVIHGDESIGVRESPGEWFSQGQIAAWIDGARSMGAGI